MISSPTSLYIQRTFGDDFLNNPWVRNDAAVYIGIAHEGYNYLGSRLQSSVPFFPLYPLLMRGVTLITGNLILSGLLISHIAFLLALIVLYQLALQEFGDSAAATRTIFYIAAFPVSYFFSAIYTESLFLLLAVGVFYCARNQQWVLAVLLGILCSATRNLGILLMGVVALEWLKAHGWRRNTVIQRDTWGHLVQNVLSVVRSDGRSLVMIPFMSAGLLLYMGYLWHSYGDPLLFVSLQSAYGRSLDGGPIGAISREMARTVSSGSLFRLVRLGVNTGTFGTAMLMVVPVWRRLGMSFALFTLLAALIPMMTSDESMMRYFSALFPVFMMLGLWIKNRWLDWGVRLSFLAGLVIFTVMVAKWYFWA